VEDRIVSRIVSSIVRTTLLLVALTGLLTGTASAAVTAQGIGCTSTRACTTSSGGALILTSRESCTAGLPVRTRAGQWYLVTAGHCVGANGSSTWRQSGVALGRGTRWEYGGKGTEGRKATGDVGLIKLAGRSKSRVLVMNGRARTQQILVAKNAKLGEKVCVTTGRTGRTQCGRVVQASASLTYASPGVGTRTISNLAMVSGICVNPGDSGSPVFAGRAAIGITVAKSSSGCYAWYTKLPAELKHFGLYVQG
jgi:streptogrisin B